MDLQTWVWIVGIVIAGLTIYNTVEGFGKTKGSTEIQLRQVEDNERVWNVRFDALHNQMEVLRSQTSDRFERMLERLNEALLTMAREHPTKNDLQMVKEEILDRIDGYESRKQRKPIIK